MSEGVEINIIERAFQLARSGACHTVNDIRERLSQEGHPNVLSHLQGASIKKQLGAILAARGVTPARPTDEDDDFEA